MDAFDDPSQRYAINRALDPSSIASTDLLGEPLDLNFRPFLEIWTSPRRTIRRIVNADPTLHVNPLIALAGIAESLDRASSRNAGDKVSLAVIFFMCVVIAPGMSLLGAWFSSHMLRISGNWLSGRGNYLALKAAIGWASVPTVVGLVLWIPLLLIFGREMFTEEMPTLETSLALGIVLLLLSLPMIVLGVWAFVLLCNTIAEVQGYRSAWKGLANIILAGLIFIVPIVLLSLGIALVANLAKQ